MYINTAHYLMVGFYILNTMGGIKLFNTSISQSPVKQDMIWCAEYADRTSLCEFDYTDHKENSFYDINKDNLIRFGLIGFGYKMYFEVSGGVFYLLNQTVEFDYVDKGKIYPLTNRQSIYNDIITYKDAEFIFDPKGRRGGYSNIFQYNFGYKNKLKLNGVDFNFQSICQIPRNQKIRFEIKLSSNQDLDGQLKIKRNGRVVESITAPLKTNKGGVVNWVMK